MGSDRPEVIAIDIHHGERNAVHTLSSAALYLKRLIASLTLDSNS